MSIKLQRQAIETKPRQQTTWETYEAEKATIKARLEAGEITADEYDRQIKQLTDKFGI